MTDAPLRPLLVGIDGSSRDAAAVRWAGDEAARGGLPLLLLCGYTTPIVASHALAAPTPWPTSEMVRADAQRHIEQALEQVNTSYPAVRAVGRAVQGHVHDALLALGQHADSLVVGCPGGPDDRISRVGLIGQPITKRSASPIVITPASSSTAVIGDVIVGVTLGNEVHHVLAYAFEHARRHAARVRILCSRPARRTGLDAESSLARFQLEERLFDVLSVWQQIYPDVPVSSTVVTDHPTARLIVESERALLLVIGGRQRRGTDWILRHRVHRLLRWTRRPVAVVPTSCY